jgi:hypothetical protein
VIFENLISGHNQFVVIGAYLLLALQLILMAEFVQYVKQRPGEASKRQCVNLCLVFAIFLVETLVTALQAMDLGYFAPIPHQRKL